jgi:hypothetical protein
MRLTVDNELFWLVQAAGKGMEAGSKWDNMQAWQKDAFLKGSIGFLCGDLNIEEAKVRRVLGSSIGIGRRLWVCYNRKVPR